MGDNATIKTEVGVAIPMRDGVVLYADVYRPDSDAKVPVLLQRTPYNKNMPPARTAALDALRAASHGYAVVVQDTRGRYSSGGEFYPFRHEIDDGYDTLEWCASQPWSSGKVGMFGRSYVGATQWLAALSGHPALVAIAPGLTASDYHEGWTYQGGAMAWGFAVSWTLSALTSANLGNISRNRDVPAGTRERLLEAIDDMHESFRTLPPRDYPHLQGGLADYFYDWIAHSRADDYWGRLRIEDQHHRLNVAVFNIAGWHDIFLKGSLRNFRGMRESGPNEEVRSKQRLIVGPWHHATPGPDVSGDVYFGAMASDVAVDMNALHLRFFDRWLKGIENNLESEPPVRIFVMGENRWRDEQEWPLARTRHTDYYLHSDGQANGADGDGSLSTEVCGAEPSDVYVYDPRCPVPTRGGGLCCSNGFLPGGAFEQKEIESRPDVLVYTSSPMTSSMEVTGPVSLVLYASSSAPDTDFTAKLVDVSPCGCTRNLTDGIVRARYRDSLSESSLIEPGKVYKYTIDLVATSNVFLPGHSVRLEVSSSNFPRFDRNPNTGREPSEEAELKPALQTVFHDEQWPSQLVLPEIPRE
ncbi:MAG: CocE/NonD family hydrolase [Dehalococcoidia bacterium]|nr:CocE/NonD family hydrolase [Dehalococcoidia bacterium]